MIERTSCWKGLALVAASFAQPDWVGFNPQSLIEDTDNVLLTDGADNYGLLEFSQPGEYFGHYLFGSARGRTAYTVAHEMLDYFFTNYPAFVVLGQTPVEHLGALWLNKKLGFKKIGTEHTEAGLCDRVFLTKEGFYK